MNRLARHGLLALGTLFLSVALSGCDLQKLMGGSGADLGANPGESEGLNKILAVMGDKRSQLALVDQGAKEFVKEAQGKYDQVSWTSPFEKIRKWAELNHAKKYSDMSHTNLIEYEKRNPGSRQAVDGITNLQTGLTSVLGIFSPEARKKAEIMKLQNQIANLKRQDEYMGGWGWLMHPFKKTDLKRQISRLEEQLAMVQKYGQPAGNLGTSSRNPLLMNAAPTGSQNGPATTLPELLKGLGNTSLTK